MQEANEQIRTRHIQCAHCGAVGTTRAFIRTSEDGTIAIRDRDRLTLTVQADGSAGINIHNPSPIIQAAIQKFGEKSIYLRCKNCQAKTTQDT